MKIIKTTTDLSVPVERGRRQMRLQAAVQYIMHDVEVENGRHAGVFQSIQTMPHRPAVIDPTTTLESSLIVPFIGG